MKRNLLCIGFGMFFFLFIRCFDSIFDPVAFKQTKCYAFLSQTGDTLSDTTYLATVDTIHTGDTIWLMGYIFPKASSSGLKKISWSFGDSLMINECFIKYSYFKSGVFTASFSIEDFAGFTMQDSVCIHVNTSPNIPLLISPDSGKKYLIDPERDLALKWSCFDNDLGDSLKYCLYLDSILPPTKLYATIKYDTVAIILKNSLQILKNYYWKIAAFDRYNDSAFSNSYLFRTKNPHAKGMVRGYACFQGWQKHNGITIILEDTIINSNKTSVSADSTGYFIKTGLNGSMYRIIACDTLNKEFSSDTLYVEAVEGDEILLDSLVLQDLIKPQIFKKYPLITQYTRTPIISAHYDDKGSGIDTLSPLIFFNDSNVTKQATISDTALYWRPQHRKPDGEQTVRVLCKDFVGNTSDTMAWSFLIDAMKLTGISDTTIPINSTLYFYGYVNDVYSKVILYKWDFDGNSTWDDSVFTSDTVISRPWKFTHEGTYNTRLFVQDDQGIIKYDTVIISVSNLNPKIDTISNDTIISINDQLLLKANVHDVDGKIIHCEWDAENDGFFEHIDTTGNTFVTSVFVKKYSTVGDILTIFRATDDDSKTSYDTINVSVVQDNPVVDAGPDTTIYINTPILLKGTAVQQFGSIVMYKWDCNGDGVYDDSSASSSSTSFIFTNESVNNAQFYVRDDDGNEASDVKVVTVINNAPTITFIRDDTIISINDSIVLFGAAIDYDGTIKEFAWDYNGDNTFDYISTMIPYTSFKYSNAGIYNAVFRVTDDYNKQSKDTSLITVMQDAPVVNAGIDTTVSINAVIHLAGSATQQFGYIVMHKWDCNGDGTYDDSSASSAITSYTYTHEAAYNTILYVRDDDGNEATNTRLVIVQNSAPIITGIRPDTIISINDSIALTATAVDIDGIIKEYAWDYTGDGTFDFSSTTEGNAGNKYYSQGTYNAIIRVTDDDNKPSEDTCLITVILDPPSLDAGPDTIVSIYDSIRLHPVTLDKFGTITKYEWSMNGNNFIPTLSGDSVVVAPTDSNANFKCVARVTDDDGNTVTDSLVVTVCQDSPKPFAGNDTTLSINDLIALHGTTSQKFGYITKWEWDFGNTGSFIQTSKADTSIIASATPNQKYPCVLQVTDDDGNNAKDTIKIIVILDPPTANPGRDTIVSINDTLKLYGSASQQFGYITKWEWDISTTGNFKQTSKGDTSIIVPSTENLSYMCALRVTDEDGLTDQRSVKVQVKSFPPVAIATANKNSVEFGENLLLSANGSHDTNLNGTIKQYAWNFPVQNASWFIVSKIDTQIVTPPDSSVFLAILRVTDDDGQVGYDTVNVIVLINDIYVDSSATGANTGGTWTNAFADLQKALTIAQYGSKIHVAKGTYYPTVTTDRTISFILKEDVKMYGMYPTGGGTRDTVNRTVLSGDIQKDGIDDNNTNHVLFATQIDSSSLLDGFIITNGYAAEGGGLYCINGVFFNIVNCTFTDNFSSSSGGAIYCNNSSPFLTNCTFNNNSSPYGSYSSSGGAICNTTSSPTLTNCTFTSNTSLYGGAIFNTTSFPTLTNCTFTDNSAPNGGAIYNFESTPTLTGCIFTDNSASYGGAVHNMRSSPSLTNCNFKNNSTTFSGGAFYNVGGSPTLTNCTLIDNFAKYGGAMLNVESSPALTNCIFTNNSSSSFGGAIYNTSCYYTPTLTNCTFTDNSSTSSGGAIYNSASNPTLTNCTFNNNLASSSGGAIYTESSSNPSLTNCIFTNNSASSGGAIYTLYTSPSLTNCTFNKNSAIQNGGAIYASICSIEITNCTFVNDTAQSGGGIFNTNKSQSKLTNCTFTTNNASAKGGAVCDSGFSVDTVKSTITNCLFWADSGNVANELSIDTFSFPTIKNCVIQGGYSGPGTTSSIITADPFLGGLTNNGGSVPTCAIPSGSPAQNAGTTAVPLGVDISKDARGMDRSDGTPDIGAFEVQ